MGRPREALAYLKKAHDLEPENLKVEEQAREIRFHHGLNLEAEGDWKDALAIFNRLRLEDDENTDYLFHEAYCRHKLGEYEEAVSLYKRGLRLEPGVVWARINLAACFYRLSRFDDAAKQWEYLVGESNQPEYVYNLGLARIRQWKVTEGWALVREAAESGYTLAAQLLQAAGMP
jgi:tetratricopeptide (TPR) repeat protein